MATRKIKSLNMLTTWARNMEFVPIYSEKHSPSPNCMFNLSSGKVCLSMQDISF